MKDSALTVHGSLQADRLGLYFAQAGLRFSHLFASDLQRAYKTAEAIRVAQAQAQAQSGGKDEDKLEVLRLEVLREQDFGSLEGQPHLARVRGSKGAGKEDYRVRGSGDSGSRDVESKESMDRRMNCFIHDHLLPVLRSGVTDAERAVCIVSHGIILSHLWRCFLKIFPQQSIAVAPGVTVGNQGPTPLERLGGWSNTGYLELDIQPQIWDGALFQKDTGGSNSTRHGSALPIEPLTMTVKTINGKEHLKGLKRTRGGVGSSIHDEGQTKIELFFKKTKTN